MQPYSRVKTLLRMRFKNFNSIYWMLAPIKILSRNEELAFDDCKRILDYLKSSLEQQVAILIMKTLSSTSSSRLSTWSSISS